MRSHDCILAAATVGLRHQGYNEKRWGPPCHNILRFHTLGSNDFNRGIPIQSLDSIPEGESVYMGIIVEEALFVRAAIIDCREFHSDMVISACN